MTFSFFPKHFRPVRSGFPCCKTDIILVGFHKSLKSFYERYKILETRCIKAILYITLLSVSHPSTSSEKKVQVKSPVSNRKVILPPSFGKIRSKRLVAPVRHPCRDNVAWIPLVSRPSDPRGQKAGSNDDRTFATPWELRKHQENHRNTCRIGMFISQLHFSRTFFCLPRLNNNCHVVRATCI
jgi:hypothetical protein